MTNEIKIAITRLYRKIDAIIRNPDYRLSNFYFDKYTPLQTLYL